VRGPFLVLAPLSTLGHWKREFEEWTDMNVVYYHDPQGGAEARELIRRCEFYYPGQQGAALAEKKHVFKFNVLITSYHVLLGDWEFLKDIRWQYVIVDEAHGASCGCGGGGGGAWARAVSTPSHPRLPPSHSPPPPPPQRSRTRSRSCRRRCRRCGMSRCCC
jgi:hypothetical protein